MPKQSAYKSKFDWENVGELPYEMVPVYKTALDCLKECSVRFRNVPSDFRNIAREIRQSLARFIANIAKLRLSLSKKEALEEATDIAIEIQVNIRVLNEIHAITPKDYAMICRYSDSMVRQMVGWMKSENKSNKESST